ncbi:MAG: hypothetical protein ACKVOH_04615, partial [Chlamydiales bacterium]
LGLQTEIVSLRAPSPHIFLKNLIHELQYAKLPIDTQPVLMDKSHAFLCTPQFFQPLFIGMSFDTAIQQYIYGRADDILAGRILEEDKRRLLTTAFDARYAELHLSRYRSCKTWREFHTQIPIKALEAFDKEMQSTPPLSRIELRQISLRLGLKDVDLARLEALFRPVEASTHYSQALQLQSALEKMDHHVQTFPLYQALCAQLNRPMAIILGTLNYTDDHPDVDNQALLVLDYDWITNNLKFYRWEAIHGRKDVDQQRYIDELELVIPREKSTNL